MVIWSQSATNTQTDKIIRSNQSANDIATQISDAPTFPTVGPDLIRLADTNKQQKTKKNNFLKPLVHQPLTVEEKNNRVYNAFPIKKNQNEKNHCRESNLEILEGIGYIEVEKKSTIKKKS